MALILCMDLNMTKNYLLIIAICFSMSTYAEEAAIKLPAHPAVTEDTQLPAAEGPLPANQIYPLLSENKPQSSNSAPATTPE